MSKAWDMRRIIEKHSHLRGTRISCTGMFSPSLSENGHHSHMRLTQLHIESITVTGTGTRQPPSCGKKPNAVGQSVMTLPGKPTVDAARLTRKGSDLLCWWQSHCSSRSAIRSRTWRRVAVQGVVRIESRGRLVLLPLMANRRPAYTTLSVRKDSLGGKAGCGESRLSGLGRGFSKPLKGNFEYGD
jgi:hypothetical protein